MLRLVSYDLENDKIRSKTSRALLREGFERIQFSVFVGEIEPDNWKEMWSKLSEIASEGLGPGDQICSFIISPEQFRKLQSLGTAPDVEYIMGEKVVLYL